MFTEAQTLQWKLRNATTKLETRKLLLGALNNPALDKETRAKVVKVIKFNDTHSYYTRDLNDDFDYPTEEDLADNVATGLFNV